ncbi:1,4-alpha-glucan branching protein GlgB [Lichenifustis flavocetrariae]|uniref:1,4-alpha-glucan branching enzyme GlgB n=1 Tax=Lichenifustis flavocetrariae TaxID=2949735 RepID=A0AA42CHV7_9HYPH|nr:1,4-alpha-glucan branching protein GlgB [Lichenifustis flavocetrariae]MCW6507684.1 1,4-alpha-glucan branching protein GlgB [Lichenifustis flavocetrariae]
MTDTGWRAHDGDVGAVLSARHGDPFRILGPHETPDGWVVRAFVPHAESVQVVDPAGKSLATLDRRQDDFFEGIVEGQTGRFAYRLRARNAGGAWEFEDPYGFSGILGDMDDYLLLEGTHRSLYLRLGAHVMTHEGAQGTNFALWAPHADRVSVVGDFNEWDGRRHVMRKRVQSGVWEIFLPGIGEGTVYKYEIIGPGGVHLPLKADPFGFASELRPSTASVVTTHESFNWTDAAFMEERRLGDRRRQPMTIYEVHLGSWKRGPDNAFLSYDDFAEDLIRYAVDLGFTHLELMPISEHPLDASWGYQPIGLFAPTRRFGDPEGFARFVDKAHAAGLGIIVDWVPAHFPIDVHGLARFDGTALYEYADPRRGFHPDWNTAIYDFARREVAAFMAANALYWLDKFHIDGLRVDAVASMLYLDYSRKEGEWIPNWDGGNDNREAIAFLRQVNELAYGLFPGAMTIAEESTAWPGVSQPVYTGGLGFGFKWNMGWMHDTLDYIEKDPIHRRFHHDRLTFGLLYAFSENFILPISHDEVVHGKKALISKMPGDEWQRFANNRAYFGFMWGHPGKKLIFMGSEFGQTAEWNFNQSLDWHLLDYDVHRGLQALVRDLNTVYRAHPALHARDCEGEGFRWIVADDRDQSVIVWARFGEPDDPPVVVACNFTPVPRSHYRFGVPKAGKWREILNTDAAVYAGSGTGNLGVVKADGPGMHGLPASAEVFLPPLACVYFEFVGA